MPGIKNAHPIEILIGDNDVIGHIIHSKVEAVYFDPPYDKYGFGSSLPPPLDYYQANLVFTVPIEKAQEVKKVLDDQVYNPKDPHKYLVEWKMTLEGDVVLVEAMFRLTCEKAATRIILGEVFVDPSENKIAQQMKDLGFDE